MLATSAVIDEVSTWLFMHAMKSIAALNADVQVTYMQVDGVDGKDGDIELRSEARRIRVLWREAAAGHPEMVVLVQPYCFSITGRCKAGHEHMI